MPPTDILQLPTWLQTVFVGLMISWLSNDWAWLNTLKVWVKNAILVLIALAVGGIAYLIQAYIPTSNLAALQPLWNVLLLALAAVGAIKFQSAVSPVWKTFLAGYQVQLAMHELMQKELQSIKPNISLRLNGYVTTEEFHAALALLKAQGAGQVG